MALWTAIKGFTTGQELTPELFNDRFTSIKERTDYLYNQLKSLISGSQLDILTIPNLPIACSTTGMYSDTSLIPKTGDIVYHNKELNRFEKAKYDVLHDNIGLLKHADSSFAMGILISKSEDNSIGTIAVAGRLDLSASTTKWKFEDHIVSGELKTEGPYYLSAVEPGKLTAVARNTVYIGYYGVNSNDDAFFIINPQYQDLVGSHRHYSFGLYSSVVGVSLNKYDIAGTSKISGYPPVAIRGYKTDYNKDIIGYFGRYISGYNPHSDTEPTFTKVNDTTITAGINYLGKVSPIGVCIVNPANPVAGPKITAISGDGSSLILDSDITDCLAINQLVTLGKNRLRIRGHWIGSYDTTYTFKLGSVTDPDVVPATFKDCVLYWSTDSGKEPAGSVPIYGYDISTKLTIQSNGVMSNIASSELVLEDNTAKWAINSLIGYTVKNLTTEESGVIKSNTATTIVIEEAIESKFNKNDEYQILGLIDKGLEVVLENNYGDDYRDTPREPGTSATYGEQDVDAVWYTWQLTLPEDIKGWMLYSHYGSLDDSASLAPINNFQMYYHTEGKIHLTNNYEKITITYPKSIISVNMVTAEAIPSIGVLKYTYNGDTTQFNIIMDWDEFQEAEGVIPIFYNGNTYDVYKQIVDHLTSVEGVTAFINLNGDTITVTAASKLVIDPTSNLIADNGLIIHTNSDGKSVKKLLIYNHYNEALGADAGVANITDSSGNLLPYTVLTNNVIIDLVNFNKSRTSYNNVGHFAALGTTWSFIIQGEEAEAVLEYNITAHTDLYSVYPPEPVAASSLVRDGIEQYSKNITGDIDTWAIYYTGLNTIYWNSNYTEHLPYYGTYVDRNIAVDYDRICVFHLAKLSMGTLDTVTSISPVEGSPLQIFKCGTKNPAISGDLEIDLDFNITTADENIAGLQVVKRVDGAKLIKGPVVEAIKSGTGIEVISTYQDGNTNQGIVTISLAGQGTVTEQKGEFSEIMLLNAKQELENEVIPYIKLVDTVPNKFIAKFRVPFNYVGTGNPYIYMTAKPEATAVSLQFTWNKISSYTAASTEVTTGMSYISTITDLTIDSTYVFTTDPDFTGNQFIAPSGFEALEVDAGDMVVLTVEQVIDGVSRPLKIYDLSWKVK